MTIDFNKLNVPRFEDAEARKDRIKATCERRIRELVRYLYPRAVITSRDARIGNISGEPGASLSIALTPDVPGHWIDHATGERGDVLTLWQKALGLRDFGEVLREAEAWAGGAPNPKAAARHQTEAAHPPAESIVKRDSARFDYLSASGDLMFTVVRKNHYFTASGEPVLKPDGKQAKDFMPVQPNGVWSYPPGPRPLYRLPEIERSREIVFVEGEKAADAIHRFGWVATTAPGGSSTKLDAIDWRPLAGKSVILWPDNDDAGRKFMGRVATELASIGCAVRWVTLPPGVPPKWDAADAGEEEIHALLTRSDTPEAGLAGQWIEEIEYTYEPELVEGLIPNNGVGVLYGPSSAGKSFVAVDWAVRMASGRQVMDRYTIPAGVLYFAAEGHSGLRKRIHAARQVHCVDGHAAPFNYLPAFLDLSKADTGDVQRLTDYAASIAGEMAERGAPLRVIIVDTLAAAAPSADENVSREMGPIMLSFHRMAAQLDCVVMLVAHTGKDVARGLRGWSGIRANVDFAIECQVEKDEDTGETVGRYLWFEKCKDGPDGFVLAEYHLKTVFLGQKPSGQHDTTCWVDYSDPPKPPKPPSEDEIRVQTEAQEKDRAEALRAEILGALVNCLNDKWRPLRETAEILRFKGGINLGRDNIIGYLISLSNDANEGITEHWFNKVKIEIQTTPKAGRFFRELRVLKEGVTKI